MADLLFGFGSFVLLKLLTDLLVVLNLSQLNNMSAVQLPKVGEY